MNLIEIWKEKKMWGTCYDGSNFRSMNIDSFEIVGNNEKLIVSTVNMEYSIDGLYEERLLKFVRQMKELGIKQK